MLDQIEIGKYLKRLRLEKNWTQALLAEKLNVSNRSISRWENGNTMPDLSLLIELSDLYQVSVDKILEGGHDKAEKENKNMEENEAMIKAAELVSRQQKKVSRRMEYLFVAALICIIVYAAIDINQLSTIEPWNSIASICMGFVTGILMTGVIYTSGHYRKIAQAKSRLFRRSSC